MAGAVPLIKIYDLLTLKEKDNGWAPDKNNLNVLQTRGYIVKETIGEGKCSKIKKAFCVKTNEVVAVKIIYKSKLRTADHRKFIPREIGILRNVHHPRLLDVLQLFESRNMYLIIMEYAPNGDLTGVINKLGCLSEVDARRLFKQLLDVVSFLHENKICHRDIKCDNILLDKNFNLKLADFGFARSVRKYNMLETNCGSYVYTAPEVLDGKKYNGFRADIWSMGVCLYCLLCGELPFRDDDIDILRYCMEEKLKFAKNVSKDCRDLIRKMMNHDPAKRPLISEIYKHKWMCKPLSGIDQSSMTTMAIQSLSGFDQSSMTTMAIQSRIGEHAEIDPTTEHGFNCDQHSTSIRPSRVTNVLQAVAHTHSTGESTVDLTMVSKIKNNSSAAITGVTGPVGRRLSKQIIDANDGGRSVNLMNKFRMAARTVTAINRFRRGPLNTILNMPQDQALQIINEKHIQDYENDKKILHSTKSSKVAKHCQEVRFHEHEEMMKPIREAYEQQQIEEYDRYMLQSTVCHLLPISDESESEIM